MAIRRVLWDDYPGGNVDHIAEHGLTPDDVDEVLSSPDEIGVSRSSGLPVALGFTSAGEYICVVFEWVDGETVYPVTAYVVEE